MTRTTALGFDPVAGLPTLGLGLTPEEPLDEALGDPSNFTYLQDPRPPEGGSLTFAAPLAHAASSFSDSAVYRRLVAMDEISGLKEKILRTPPTGLLSNFLNSLYWKRFGSLVSGQVSLFIEHDARYEVRGAAALTHPELMADATFLSRTLAILDEIKERATSQDDRDAARVLLNRPRALLANTHYR